MASGAPVANLCDRNRLPRALPVWVAIAGLLAAPAAALVWRTASDAVEDAAAELDAANLLASRGPREREAAPRRAPQPPAAKARADAEREAAARLLQVDWNGRLSGLEQAVGGMVTLVGLRVDGARDAIEIRGVVAAIDELDRLARRLSDIGAAAIHVQRHEPVGGSTGPRRSFVASVQWP